VLASFSIPFLPPTASTDAVVVNRLFWSLTVLCAAITLLVILLVVVWGVRYHATSRASRANRIVHVRRFEIGWISLLFLISVGIFIWSGVVFYRLRIAPLNARTIYVVGRQWMWKAEHSGPDAGDRREIDELHIPVGEPIRLILASQDVIHSFFIPAFRVKQDAVPGRYTTMWFQPTVAGEYHLFCAEYCGTDHSVMRGRIVVMEPAEFQRWLSPITPVSTVPGTPGTPQAPMAIEPADGRPAAPKGAFFRLGCIACHVPNSFLRAPRLDGIWAHEIRLNNGQGVIGDENYIRESILEPNAKISAGYPAPSLMPSYQGQVSEDDLRELIEFIRSLEHGWPPQYQQDQRPQAPVPSGRPPLPARPTDSAFPAPEPPR
jgi:cytochrome c oxidase subunit 2